MKLIPLDKVETITKIDRYEEPSGQLIAERGWLMEDAVEFRASRAGTYLDGPLGRPQSYGSRVGVTPSRSAG